MIYLETELKPTPLFNPETGIATSDFQVQLERVGLVMKQHIDAFPANHAVNVCQTLHDAGCYQENFDHYKDGGDSAFHLNLDQAAAHLNHIYNARRKILPDESSTIMDGILCSGVSPSSIPATLAKRFRSLKASITEKNLNFERVYILCKNDEVKSCSRDFIEKLQIIDQKFNRIDFTYIVANVDRNIGRTCVDMLHKRGGIENPYVVITDATSGQKDYLTATSVLTSSKCHGIALAPITNWIQEMNLYGYQEALGSYENAAIAWARTDWNFVTRRADLELSALNVKVHS